MHVADITEFLWALSAMDYVKFFAVIAVVASALWFWYLRHVEATKAAAAAKVKVAEAEAEAQVLAAKTEAEAQVKQSQQETVQIGIIAAAIIFIVKIWK